ncbi:hypothetical protein AAVH_23969 [Aphelenchoides avenae]|nr:hypothetical protein AAVH_23969 [Aphelenchus avenae]
MTHVYAYRDKGFQEQGRHVLAVNEWDVSDYIVTIGAKLVGSSRDLDIEDGIVQSEWMLQYFLLMWFCTCFLAISIVIVVEFKIKAYFSSIGGVSHQSTKKLHKDFHRALLAMVCGLASRACIK